MHGAARLIFSIEKWRGVVGLNTGNFISLVLLGRWWRGRSTSSGGGRRYSRLKGCGRVPLPSASWAENTIMTECTQESGSLCALLSVVFAVCIYRAGEGKRYHPRRNYPQHWCDTMGESEFLRIRRVFERTNVYVQYVNYGIAKKFAEGYKGHYYADSFALWVSVHEDCGTWVFSVT